MNISNARSIKTFKGWIGEYRPFWKSDYQPVLRRDEKGRACGPEYFASADAAEVAAWRILNEQQQPHMVRSGEIIPAAKIEAEKHFKGKAA